MDPDQEQKQSKRKQLMWALAVLALILLGVGGYVLYSRGHAGSKGTVDTTFGDSAPRYRFKFY